MLENKLLSPRFLNQFQIRQTTWSIQSVCKSYLLLSTQTTPNSSLARYFLADLLCNRMVALSVIIPSIPNVTVSHYSHQLVSLKGQGLLLYARRRSLFNSTSTSSLSPSNMSTSNYNTNCTRLYELVLFKPNGSIM